MKKKDWLEWFDKLDEKDLTNILSSKDDEYESPLNVDNKIRQIIKEKRITLIERIKNRLGSFLSGNFLIAYPLSAAAMLIVILSAFFLIRILNKYQARCIVASVTGNVYSLDKKDKKISIGINNNIKENYTVFSEKESSVMLKINNKDDINIGENTKVKLTRLFKNIKKEETCLYLFAGESNFKIHKLNEKSYFKVETDTIQMDVIGTDFTVFVDKDNVSNVLVNDGKISVLIKFEKIKLNEFLKDHKNLRDKINNLLDERIILNTGESLQVSFDDLKESDLKITSLINEIKNEISANIFNKEKETKKLSIIRDIKNSLIIKDKDRKDNDQSDITETASFIINKLKIKPDIKLTEKYNSISSYNNNIYISSDNNKAIYCLSGTNGNIIWQLKDNSIDKITSSLMFINNNIILATPSKIITINKSGRIINSIDIMMGPILWADSIKIGDSLYIPGAKNIYKFDGVDLTKIDIPESMGQLFISYYKNNIFCTYPQERAIKVFDLEKNKIIWESDKLTERSYMTPLVYKDYIIIGDIKNNIYRYNYKSSNTNPDIIKINKGIISDIININSIIYFVANDGYFYSLNIEAFNSPKKILKIDKNPVIDKYLTKNLFLYKDYIFFSSDTGRIFYYNIKDKKADLINIKQNKDNNPFIGTPVLIKDSIFFIDIKSNIYKLEIKK